MATLGSEQDELDTPSMENRRLKINTHQTLTAASLPEHLIIELILPRLPVKPLTRFKAVSKYWYSIISSSQFAESHLKFSSLRPQFVVHTYDLILGYNLFLLPCNQHDGDIITLDFDRNCVVKSLAIAGSCNGLLCLCIEEYEQFCVWNPVTHQFREIKNPVGVSAMRYDYVFGYVSSIDDYKIVAVFHTKINDVEELYVFSLRKGEWKRIDGLDELDGVYDYPSIWFDNRTIVCKDMYVWQKVKHPVWFDLVDDKFKQIPWIDCFNRYKSGKFFEMEGVCVSSYCEGDQGFDVWVLKQFGDENSWEKHFSFDIGGLSFLNFTHTGMCLALEDGPGQLKVIASNQESPSPEETRVSAHLSRSLRETAVYVESFVSPFLN